MKANKLNLENALHLASILSKYVDIETSLEKSAFEFVDEIIQKISPEEYLRCISLITNEDTEDIIKEESIDLLALFTEGLVLNTVATLLEFYKKLKNGNPKQ